MATKSQIIPANDVRSVAMAVAHLRDGRLVAVPTETVYGLAANALDNVAVQHIYTTKGRPSNNPLICHVANAEMAERYVTVCPLAKELMTKFWPGPLTLVLPYKTDSGVSKSVTAGLTTLAVRCPDSSITLDIIKSLNKPVAAPSANPSGKLSPTTAQDVAEYLAHKIPLILDGGQTTVGIESTIVSVQDDCITLLRPGSITSDEITEHTGQPVYDRNSTEITAPGQLLSHYAPKAKVRLNATNASKNEILIGFGEVSGTFNLSETGNLTEAAHNLFAYLRKADDEHIKTIAVAPIPAKGIGIAINDRLNRAAAPRNTI